MYSNYTISAIEPFPKIHENSRIQQIHYCKAHWNNITALIQSERERYHSSRCGVLIKKSKKKLACKTKFSYFLLQRSLCASDQIQFSLVNIPRLHENN